MSEVYKIVYLVDCRYWKELFSTTKLDFTMEMLFEKMSNLRNGTNLRIFCDKKIIMTMTKQNMDVEK